LRKIAQERGIPPPVTAPTGPEIPGIEGFPPLEALPPAHTEPERPEDVPTTIPAEPAPACPEEIKQEVVQPPFPEPQGKPLMPPLIGMMGWILAIILLAILALT